MKLAAVADPQWEAQQDAQSQQLNATSASMLQSP
jgi:hypothetical protein